MRVDRWMARRDDGSQTAERRWRRDGVGGVSMMMDVGWMMVDVDGWWLGSRRAPRPSALRRASQMDGEWMDGWIGGMRRDGAGPDGAVPMLMLLMLPIWRWRLLLLL